MLHMSKVVDQGFQPPRETEPESWECSRCTFANSPGDLQCRMCDSHQDTEDVLNFFCKHNTRVQRLDDALSNPDDSRQNGADVADDDAAGDWVEQPSEQKTTAGVHQLVVVARTALSTATPVAFSHHLNWHQYRLFEGLPGRIRNRVVTNAFLMWRIVLQGTGSDLFLSLIFTYVQPCHISDLAATSKFWFRVADKVMTVSGVRKRRSGCKWMSAAVALKAKAAEDQLLSQGPTVAVKKRNKFKARRAKKRRQKMRNRSLNGKQK